MAENNNNLFQINENMLRADKVEVKSLTDITNYLRQNNIVDEDKIDEYSKKITEDAQRIADAINKKISEREVTVENLMMSDDELVKNYMVFAENEIKAIIKAEWKEVNKTLEELVWVIDNMNNKDRRVNQKTVNLISNVRGIKW